jgi:hypothetical protein
VEWRDGVGWAWFGFGYGLGFEGFCFGGYAPPLHHAPAEVAAVLALHGYVLGAFEGGLECCGGVLAMRLSPLVYIRDKRKGEVLWVPQVKKKNMAGYGMRVRCWCT